MTEFVLFILLVEVGIRDEGVLDCDIESRPPTIDDQVCCVLEDLLFVWEANLLWSCHGRDGQAWAKNGRNIERRKAGRRNEEKVMKRKASTAG